MFRTCASHRFPWYRGTRLAAHLTRCFLSDADERYERPSKTMFANASWFVMITLSEGFPYIPPLPTPRAHPVERALSCHLTIAGAYLFSDIPTNEYISSCALLMCCVGSMQEKQLPPEIATVLLGRVTKASEGNQSSRATVAYYPGKCRASRIYWAGLVKCRTVCNGRSSSRPFKLNAIGAESPCDASAASPAVEMDIGSTL